ncbi:MAG: SagB/ThcOx family dehydrogenase [Acidobacteria bacterium]|nr:SagB/ThcOx family dehydrogenase [Acidobacteriota bacterium]
MAKKVVLILLTVFLCTLLYAEDKEVKTSVIQLPKPDLKGTMSVEEAIQNRRTRRSYADTQITQKQLSQLLWASQGITGEMKRISLKLRSVPSAGGLYPLKVYVAIREKAVTGIEAGIYLYEPEFNLIKQVVSGDKSAELTKATDQSWVGNAPLCFIITAEPKITMQKYWHRSMPYIYMEAGHLGQNLQLQGEALKMALCLDGWFHDEQIIELLNLSYYEIPIYIISAGMKPAQETDPF